MNASTAKREPKGSKVVKWVKIFRTEKRTEIHLVRLTEACDKVESENNG